MRQAEEIRLHKHWIDSIGDDTSDEDQSSSAISINTSDRESDQDAFINSQYENQQSAVSLELDAVVDREPNRDSLIKSGYESSRSTVSSFQLDAAPGKDTNRDPLSKSKYYKKTRKVSFSKIEEDDSEPSSAVRFQLDAASIRKTRNSSFSKIEEDDSELSPAVRFQRPAASIRKTRNSSFIKSEDDDSEPSPTVRSRRRSANATNDFFLQIPFGRLPINRNKKKPCLKRESKFRCHQDAASLYVELEDVEQYLATLKKSIIATTPAPAPAPESKPSSRRRFSMAIGTSGTAITYPDDCFSFLAIYGPIENPVMFFFGFGIFSFQFIFLVLAILSVVHPKWKTTDVTYNPNEFWHFIPSNIPPLVRTAQIMAVMSFCLFAETSLKDIITAVELFPQYSKVTKSDKYGCIVLSCVLRFIMGILTVGTTFLMITTSESVIDTILDFLAMTFIADIGKMAFQLALWGKYGPKLEEEARIVEDLPVPDCMIKPHSNKRYLRTILPIVFFLLAALAMVIFAQEIPTVWHTEKFSVQFINNAELEPYSGCYNADNRQSWGYYPYHKRIFFSKSCSNNTTESGDCTAKFGYCRNDNEWLLSKSDLDNPCKIKEEEILARSSGAIADIASALMKPWFDVHGMSIDLYTSTDTDKMGSCDDFWNNGRCDHTLNTPGRSYDGGDCCASTCTKSNCGINGLTSAFGRDSIEGDGFPSCKDPAMVPITIFFDNITYEHQQQQLPFADRGDDVNEGDCYNTTINTLSPTLHSDDAIIEPTILIDCDDRNILTVDVNGNMTGQMETIMVEDGANCTIRINNYTSTSIAKNSSIWYVNYTVYHGDNTTVEDNPIVILQEQSVHNEYAYFERIPKCYFAKLSDHLDNTTIYTGTGPQNRAIEWLQMNSRISRNSMCEDDSFVERYALSVLNFAAPIQPPLTPQDDPITDDVVPKFDLSTDDTSLITNFTTHGIHEARRIFIDKLWINEKRHCIWRNVKCDGWSVESLDLQRFDLTGTIASSIGLLTKLTALEVAHNHLTGTIPTEVGLLTLLKTLSFDGNYLSGTIPSEIGEMTNLEVLNLSNNFLNGTIPTELKRLAVNHNLTKVYVANTTLLIDPVPTGLEGVVHSGDCRYP